MGHLVFQFPGKEYLMIDNLKNYNKSRLFVFIAIEYIEIWEQQYSEYIEIWEQQYSEYIEIWEQQYSHQKRRKNFFNKKTFTAQTIIKWFENQKQ